MGIWDSPIRTKLSEDCYATSSVHRMVLGRATSNPSNWRINNKWPPDFATGKYESTLKITAIGAPFSIALAVFNAATVCPRAGGLELPPMLGKIRSVAGVVPVVPAAAQYGSVLVLVSRDRYGVAPKRRRVHLAPCEARSSRRCQG
jgi:hypothetical protein